LARIVSIDKREAAGSHLELFVIDFAMDAPVTATLVEAFAGLN
jgi:hypothetical protein